MAAGAVIVNFDVLKQLPAKGSGIHQRLTVNALHPRIVVAVATVGVHDYSVGGLRRAMAVLSAPQASCASVR